MVVAFLFNSDLFSSAIVSGGFMRHGTAFWALLLTPALFTPSSSAAEQSPLPAIGANDNRTPAGNLKNGILNLRWDLRQARWYAEALDGVCRQLVISLPHDPAHVASADAASPELQTRR